MTSSYLVRVVGSLLAALFCMFGCARREPPLTQHQPSPSPIVSASQSAQPAPATFEEAKEVVKRVFKDAALIDTAHTPNYVTGDFNGDGSADIAVIIRSAPEKISEMNQEFPPWILRDPFLAVKPGAPPLRIAPNDLLLAVIHGYGPNGWRDDQATQTYLLKNAVGSDAKTRTKSDFLAANQGKTVPRLYGDLIDQGLQGKSGYLYFAGASYAWYDPRTFKGEADARVVHSGKAPTDRVDLLNLRTKTIAREK